MKLCNLPLLVLTDVISRLRPNTRLGMRRVGKMFCSLVDGTDAVRPRRLVNMPRVMAAVIVGKLNDSSLSGPTAELDALWTLADLCLKTVCTEEVGIEAKVVGGGEEGEVVCFTAPGQVRMPISLLDRMAELFDLRKHRDGDALWIEFNDDRYMEFLAALRLYAMPCGWEESLARITKGYFIHIAKYLTGMYRADLLEKGSSLNGSMRQLQHSVRFSPFAPGQPWLCAEDRLSMDKLVAGMARHYDHDGRRLVWGNGGRKPTVYVGDTLLSDDQFWLLFDMLRLYGRKVGADIRLESAEPEVYSIYVPETLGIVQTQGINIDRLEVFGYVGGIVLKDMVEKCPAMNLPVHFKFDQGIKFEGIHLDSQSSLGSFSRLIDSGLIRRIAGTVECVVESVDWGLLDKVGGYCQANGVQVCVDHVTVDDLGPVTRVLEAGRAKVKFISLKAKGSDLEGMDVERFAAACEKSGTKMWRCLVTDDNSAAVARSVQEKGLAPQGINFVNYTLVDLEEEEEDVSSDEMDFPDAILRGFEGRFDREDLGMGGLVRCCKSKHVELIVNRRLVVSKWNFTI